MWFNKFPTNKNSVKTGTIIKINCSLLLIVSLSSMKQLVKVAVDNTKTIKVDSSGTKTRVNDLSEEMKKFNAGMNNLTNYVKVLLLNSICNVLYIYINFPFIFFILKMRTVNVYDYFPCQDDETLDAYLKKDRHYEERKEQLSTIISNAIPEKKESWKCNHQCPFSPKLCPLPQVANY